MLDFQNQGLVFQMLIKSIYTKACVPWAWLPWDLRSVGFKFVTEIHAYRWFYVYRGFRSPILFKIFVPNLKNSKFLTVYSQNLDILCQQFISNRNQNIFLVQIPNYITEIFCSRDACLPWVSLPWVQLTAQNPTLRMPWCTQIGLDILAF